MIERSKGLSFRINNYNYFYKSKINANNYNIRQ